MNGLAAYAGAVSSPLLLLAVESTRRFLKDVLPAQVIDQADLPLNTAFRMAPADEAAALKRWPADCRMSVLQFEALSGLSWRVIEGAETGEGGGGELRLGPATKAPVLVTLTRPGFEVLKAQAQRVAELADDRLKTTSTDLPARERLAEISAQVVPQYAFWSSVLPIQPERMPRTLELMELALGMAFVVAQRFKHALGVPRPHVVNPSVCPVLLTPGHSSLPSGHATEAFTVATVLTELLGAQEPTRKVLRRLAQRIAQNREVAGLHYPIDTMAGKLLGTVLGEFLVARCVPQGQLLSGSFRGENLQSNEEGLDTGEPDEGPTTKAVLRGPKALDLSGMRSPGLAWLWDEARIEWGAKPAPAAKRSSPRRKR